MITRLRRIFSEERDPTLLGLVRVALAALLFWNTLSRLLELRRDGYFGDYFFLPLVSPSWVPSHTLYGALLVLKLVAATFALVGIVPRIGLFTASAIGLYLLACDTLQYHNNRAAAHLVALLVSFTPCERSFLLVRRSPRSSNVRAVAPFWAVYLTKIQISVLYLVSGAGKLLDPDWRGGQVILLRWLIGLEVALQRGIHLPEFVTAIGSSPVLAGIASQLAIGTELFLAFGLWVPRLRALALFVGVWFHLGIQASASVDLFSWLMLSSYILFVTPELRERTLLYEARSRAGRSAARAVTWLDWLLRFRVAESPPDGASERGLSVLDRESQRHVGLSAFAELCRAIPIAFPIWVPIAALARIRKRSAHAAVAEPVTSESHRAE